MNTKIMRPMNIAIAGGLMITGLLTGCGSQSTSTNQNSAANSSATSSQSDQNHKGQGLLQALENAGASETEAKDLEKLIRENHIQMKWVMEQLKNKVPVSTITNDIKNGTAPKMEKGTPPQSHSNTQTNNTQN